MEDDGDFRDWSKWILASAISHVSVTDTSSLGLWRNSSRIGMEEGCEMAPMASAACHSII